MSGTPATPANPTSPDIDPAPVDLAKALEALPEAVRKAVGDQLAAAEASTAEALSVAKAAQESAAAAAAAAAVERDARLAGEYVAKAESFRGLPITAAELGPVLRSIDEKLTPEHAETVRTLLASVSEARGFDALTKNVSGTPVAPSNGSALEAITKAAAKIRSDRPDVTEIAALDMVLDANPSLAAAYSAEQRATATRTNLGGA